MAAKGVELASAYISLNVSTDSVPRQIRNALNGVKDIDVDVDVNTSGAQSNMARFRASQEKPIHIKVDVDTRSAMANVRGLSRNMEMLGRSDVFKLGIGAAALSSLPAFASGLAEVAAAMQQVAQAGLAIPGGIAGAVSSIGTLAFGLTGVSDAYEALGKASDDAATSGGDAASAARAQMSASNGLRNAVVDETQARKDVARATRDARNELMDLNIEMRGGLISEKRAVLEAQKAREELMSGNFTDVRDQLLRIEEADQRVIETRARNAQGAEELADANAKGVANSDQVVAANERLTRSQQNVAEANAAVAASAPQASSAQQDAALAMSKLHPEAQKFVETLRGVATGPIADLRNLVQGNIFAGLSGELETLTGKLMPTLEKGLGGIGDAWNETFKELGEVLGKDENVSLLDRIFGNTEEAQKRLTGIIDPLVEGVGTLTAAGTDALPRMADALVTVSDRFANFITEADADGSLDRWIDEGLTALGHLGETALNVGKIFTAITSAAGPTDLLGDIERITSRWQEFLNSTEGQNKLREFFADGKRVWEEWKPVLEDVATAFKDIVTFLGDHPGLVKTAAEAYLLFKGAQVLGAIGTLSQRLTGLGNQLGKPGNGKGGRGGAGILGQLSLLGALGLGGAALAADDETLDGQRQGALATLGSTALGGAAIAGLPGFLAGTGIGGALAIIDAFREQEANRPVAPQPGGSTGAPFIPGQTNPPGSGTPGRNPLDVFSGRSSVTPQSNAAPTLDDLLGLGGGGGGQGAGLNLALAGLDAALLANVPAGQYAQVQAADLTQGVADCSSAVEDLVNILDGRPTGGRSMSTHNANQWLTSRGFIPGTMPGAFNVGFNSGHMQATLPGGTPFNWGSDASAARGGVGGTGAFDPAFTSHYYRPVRTFDTGGWLPPGVTVANNQTGKPELILTPEQVQQMAQMGVDPNTLVHGGGAGAQPGPGPQQPGIPGVDPSIEQQFGFGSQPGDMNFAGRTEGYIPAGAGFSGKTGGGVAGSLIGLGGEAAKGAIQMAADLGKMAASAAAAGATMGAGAAAGPGAGAGIQIAADIAKRGVDWGVDMANIGVGALSEIFMPFGAPRWFSDVDATSFMPQMGIQSAATTSVEQMAQAQLQNQLTPEQVAGQAPPMPPPGQHMPPGAQPGVPPPPGPQPGTPAPQAPPPQQPPSNTAGDPMNWLKTLMPFDTGGILQPNSMGVNLSRRPEYVFTQSQFKAMEAGASQNAGGSVTYNVQGVDLNEALRELKKVERRQSGPTMRGKAGR